MHRCEFCGKRFATSRGLKSHCFHPRVQHFLTMKEYDEWEKDGCPDLSHRGDAPLPGDDDYAYRAYYGAL